jgi:polyhydroxyalkanoate synthesis repressor PhaR
MAESPPSTADTVPQHPPVVVKKYANRRLYNTETSSYITLDNLADMVRLGRDFVVYDAKTGDDITRSVLTQIIVEEESKGTSMLPTNFLRQLIGYYGDSLQGVVPRYLESAMSNFARQQQQMRQVMQQTFTPFLPMGVDELSRQNIALMERAMAMFNPFHRPGEGGKSPEPAPSLPQHPSAGALPAAPAEVDSLRHEVESLRAQLAIARAEAAVQPPPALAEPGKAGAPDFAISAASPAEAAPAAPLPASPLVVARRVRSARKT